MKIITLRTQIRELPDVVRKAWERADGSWLRILQDEPDTKKIHAAVAALDLEVATREDIAKAMGYSGWIYDPRCHECGRNVELTVQLGEEPDYESCTADICLECLREALKRGAQ